MATLTVEINSDQELSVLQALLKRLDLKYTIDDESWAKNLLAAEAKGIKAGLADIENGLVYTHEEVKLRIDQKLQNFRNK